MALILNLFKLKKDRKGFIKYILFILFLYFILLVVYHKLHNLSYLYVSRYGKNELARPDPKSFFRLWLEAFNDTTLMILIVLAIISLIIAFAVEHGADLSWLDGVAILATVLVVTCMFSFPHCLLFFSNLMIFSSSNCICLEYMVSRTAIPETE